MSRTIKVSGLLFLFLLWIQTQVQAQQGPILKYPPKWERYFKLRKIYPDLIRGPPHNATAVPPHQWYTCLKKPLPASYSQSRSTEIGESGGINLKIMRNITIELRAQFQDKQPGSRNHDLVFTFSRPDYTKDEESPYREFGYGKDCGLMFCGPSGYTAIFCDHRRGAGSSESLDLPAERILNITINMAELLELDERWKRHGKLHEELGIPRPCYDSDDVPVGETDRVGYYLESGRTEIKTRIAIIPKACEG